MALWARTITVFLLLLATLYRCFWNLGNAPWERWDEETNVSVVRDTITRGSFPILFLQDKPFFEKPPIWYYTNIAVGALADITPISMRIVSAISGFLVILLTAFLAWKWWGWIAGITSWIVLLLTNHLFVTNPGGIFSTHTFRSADVDALFLLFLLATICTKNPTFQGIFTGLAVLTKGALGILPLLVLSLLQKTNKKIWATAMGVVLPWYLFMWILYGIPFLREHIGYHAIARTIYPVEGHNNPVLYYAGILSNRTFFPSGELLLFAIAWNFLHHSTRRDSRVGYVTVLTIAFFIIPTLAQTRLAWYILPMYPFAALTIGAAVSQLVAQIRKT